MDNFKPDDDENPFNQFESAIFNVEPNQPLQVGNPQLKSKDVKFSSEGYTLSVEPVYGATHYIWETDKGSIYGTTNSATLYSADAANVKVRVYNELCDVYSPYSTAKIWVSGGPFINSEYNPDAINEKTYFIQNMILGVSIIWGLTNTVDFEIVDVWDNYVKVRSHSYNQEASLTAVIRLQGYNNLYLSRPVYSDPWDINGISTMSCAESEFTSSVIYDGTESIKWTCSNSIEITTDNTQSKIKAKGISNDKYGWIELQLTQNGKVYKKRKDINVIIPYAFDLVLQNLWVENGYRYALIRAEPKPYVRYDYYAYKWGITRGSSIKPCADDPYKITISDER